MTSRDRRMSYVDVGGRKQVLTARLADVLRIIRDEMPVRYHPAWDRRVLVGFRDRGLIVLHESDNETWTGPGLTELDHAVLQKWLSTRGTAWPSA
ncbi:hypothetical protein OG948_60475 (plasmid) [Embleya sp. NBC_00888]|uniref:hypothetical protein n=1 Tax=Embleya sp. NBC_00888 TaxID=2975960 RepID=UPI003870DB16|nr:hypothetical protein OG948_60475 [Embleya sp. NBC_00888]